MVVSFQEKGPRGAKRERFPFCTAVSATTSWSLYIMIPSTNHSMRLPKFSSVSVSGYAQPDAQRDLVRAGREDQEVEHVVGHEAKGHHRRDHREHDPAATFVVQRLDRLQDRLVQWVERRVGPVEAGRVHDDVLFGRMLDEPVPQREVVDALVQVRVVVWLHEVLEHQLPVPRIVGNIHGREAHHVLDVVVLHLGLEGRERRRSGAASWSKCANRSPASSTFNCGRQTSAWSKLFVRGISGVCSRRPCRS